MEQGFLNLDQEFSVFTINFYIGWRNTGEDGTGIEWCYDGFNGDEWVTSPWYDKAVVTPSLEHFTQWVNTQVKVVSRKQ